MATSAAEFLASERLDNLPSPLTSFVGREQTVAELTKLLEADRLVTLSGAPGVGKTRLALRVAAEVRERFEDGVWLAELAPLAEPALVPATVARAVGLRDVTSRPPMEMLRAYLAERQVLLVLDNCEHLLDACAALVGELLSGCPSLRVLATSREPLGLMGEAAWPVPSLTVPEPAHVGPDPPVTGKGTGEESHAAQALFASEAGRLFADRARAVHPRYEMTARNAAAAAEICRRLDGIPLAIELAAMRLRTLPAGEIAARLDDRFALLTGGSRTALPRHRTLRAAIDWSHGLLTEPERVLLRRLAVFAGGWTLEAAEWVADSEYRVAGSEASPATRYPLPATPPPATLDLLAGLVDKSLVLAEERGGGVRYRMLETVREYAAERLRTSGEEAVLRARHLGWLLELAEQGAPQLSGLLEAAWVDRLDAEMDNVRAALTWAREATIHRDAGASAAFAASGPPAPTLLDAALRLAAAGYWVWCMRGYAAEGRAWLEQLLDLEQESGDREGPDPTLAQRRALAALGYLVFLAEGEAAATRVVAEADALGAAAGDRRGRVFTMGLLGELAASVGRFDRAIEILEEQLALARAEMMPVFICGGLIWLGEVARTRGDLGRAELLFEECLAVAREFDLASVMGDTLDRLGSVAADSGDHARAATLHREALAVHRPLEYGVSLAVGLEDLSWDLVALRQADPAALLLGAAAALRERLGLVHPLFADWQAKHEAAAGAARRALGDAAFNSAHERGRRLPLAEALDFALLAAGPGAPSTPSGPDARENLTPREREIARMVAAGHTNRQIADALVVSERTVEWHVANVLAKLGVQARAQLAVWAAEHGLNTADTA